VMALAEEHPAQGRQRQHRSSVRRRQLLPEVAERSGGGGEAAAPAGGWGSSALGRAWGWLQARLQLLRQVLGGGPSTRGTAPSNCWIEGGTVVPWYWRPKAG
jgi:hypothetical protein